MTTIDCKKDMESIRFLHQNRYRPFVTVCDELKELKSFNDDDIRSLVWEYINNKDSIYTKNN